MTALDNMNVVETVEDLYVVPLPTDEDGQPRIRRVLITNRGEIACRIIATCRKLNIIAIGVYVDEDSSSQHIVEADEAIGLGAIDQVGGNPYLNIELLVRVAREARADAVHPGYGYLSENAKFVDAVIEAGIAFIGPASDAMSTLGDKRSAKAYLREHDANIPLIPGVADTNQDAEGLERLAADVGYPVMLKASAGGGGKGMRIVREPSQFRAELERAQSEAQRFFGLSDCILEKYIEAGKHIEIQIIGDKYGNVYSLNERECSIQRRHQKVIEETPSPWLDARKRQEMGEVAVRIGKLLNYENAGTVEFVFDVSTGNFYFLEVNTRLQVEHPITEETTRLDIVALQLFVASGGDLSTLDRLRRVQQVGHAIECRLCAEDPVRDFAPENGTIRLWEPARQWPHVRFETGVATGSHISIHFDSMIAKIVVWASTRAIARTTMIRVLAETACIGVRTNQLFLQSCLLNDGFSDPAYTTSFIPQRMSELAVSPYAQHASRLKSSLPLLMSHVLYSLPRHLPKPAYGRPFSNIRPRFRNQAYDSANGTEQRTIVVTDSTAHVCSWQPQDTKGSRVEGSVACLPKPTVTSDGTPGASARYNALSNALRAGTLPNQSRHGIAIRSCNAVVATSKSSRTPWIRATMGVTLDGVTLEISLATEQSDLTASTITHSGKGIRMMCHVPQLGTWFDFNVFSLLSYFEHVREAVGGGAEMRNKVIKAPMPCKVLTILKQDGDQVEVGDQLMVVESMKMEMNIAAAVSGTFSTKVREQEAVDEGTILCAVE